MSRGAIFAYCGCGAVVAAALIDEYSGLRKWRTARHQIATAAGEYSDLRLRAAVRPPPIGCAEWPAGRVLLECALADDVHSDSVVLELGAGIGMTSIGLALATGARVVATDVDDDALDNLRANAERHKATLTVARWDATGGATAVRQLPIAAELTHVLGSDLCYSGGAEAPGLAATLSELLRVQPDLAVRLLLVDRFSGGAVAAVAAVAGVEHEATTTDVAIVQFERACAKHGLSTRRHPVPDDAADRVARQLDPWTRFQWWLSGAWEGFVLYEISTQKGSS